MNQPLAYIHPQAKIARNVVIEPFSTIHKNVEIDEGTWIGPNVTIFEGARIGKNVKIYPGAETDQPKTLPTAELVSPGCPADNAAGNKTGDLYDS